jgi:hypothetical protein
MVYLGISYASKKEEAPPPRTPPEKQVLTNIESIYNAVSILGKDVPFGSALFLIMLLLVFLSSGERKPPCNPSNPDNGNIYLAADLAIPTERLTICEGACRVLP